ncbi:Trypsin 3A1 [Eumeta japonica]|uniref:Trypsin 3A1 n=1 Tax=Eumeta variegata TaxID=151549 RepID=A0A4C1TS29_EUMVA|nr:Trypsin 3A1 [Eumeta japonica]
MLGGRSSQSACRLIRSTYKCHNGGANAPGRRLFAPTMYFIVVTLLTLLAYVEPSALKGGRVVGGEPIDIKEAPYQVSLQLAGRHHCGASLIDRDLVLTAAHCIWEMIKGFFFQLEKVDSERWSLANLPDEFSTFMRYEAGDTPRPDS